jgi:hypothetical protein
MQALIVLVIALAIGCTPTRGADVPAAALDPTRLSHVLHAQIACRDCHRSDTRPGSDDHKPCDDGKCHRKDFLAPPGKLCDVCHTKITTNPLDAPLRPYPIDDAWQALPPKFSHQQHMDRGKMEGRVGFHINCVDCHTRGDGSLQRPDHATCARCHATEAGLPHAPRMEDCTQCHTSATQQRTRPRLIHDDLHFEHDRHRTDRRGTPIACDQCHPQSERSTAYADHAPPRVESCVGCHDDTDRTPNTMRMRVCETCHSARISGLATLAPRNHLPATERPLDHTIAFRRDHTDAAERDAARCAACHTQMSGNAAQACDECHQTMKPTDHRITWRELDHGPDAAADRDRCARCHVVEFCTACHAQRPRSHGSFGSFVEDHGRQARVNVRSCLTCHGDSFCITCHKSAAVPRGSR